MVDRTSAHLRVVDCPTDQVGAVREILDRTGLHLEFVEDDNPADHELGLGLVYMDQEIGCGVMNDVAQQLQERAPGASWEASEDPAYFWVGTVHRYTPALGWWSADCDDDGKPLFDEKGVNALVAASRIDPAVTDKRIGRTHAQTLEALAIANRDVVLTTAETSQD